MKVKKNTNTYYKITNIIIISLCLLFGICTRISDCLDEFDFNFNQLNNFMII